MCVTSCRSSSPLNNQVCSIVCPHIIQGISHGWHYCLCQCISWQPQTQQHTCATHIFMRSHVLIYECTRASTHTAADAHMHTYRGIQQYAKMCSKWLKRLRGCSASINDVGCFSQCMAKRCSGRMSMKHKIWATSDAYEYFGLLWIWIQPGCVTLTPPPPHTRHYH